MARQGTFDHPVIPVGPTSARLVTADSFWRRIHNMVPTDAGGVKSISTPIPLVTNAGVTPTEGTSVPTEGSIAYNAPRSIFHAYVGDGARELLLMHIDNQIWEFMGWEREWRVLIAVSTSSPVLAQNLQTPLPSDFPTQWVKTPRGVVIIPQGGQACFYDGTVCLQLGYTDRPSPPVGLGPKSSGSELLPDDTVAKIGINDEGYAVDGLYAQASTGMPAVFGTGRLGTVVPATGLSDPTTDMNVTGYLLPGRYRAKQQWIDYFGNLSPLSYQSNDVNFDYQPAAQLTLTDYTNFEITASPYTTSWTQLENVKKQVGWAGLQSGPTGTIGRIVYRTKDIFGKGDSEYYELPADASVNTNAFATLPDNVTHFLPDNIPDEWLYNKPEEIDPVPPFRLADIGLGGSLIIANTRAEPGAAWISLPGRYGTFPSKWKFYPDPKAAEITGIKTVEGGTLLFTRNGTFMVTPNDSGDGWRSFTVDATKGCVAPSSIRTMARGGKTMWLGHNGFYSWSPSTGVQFEWDEHLEDARRFNRGRLHKAVADVDGQTGQYRCWVPMYASTQNNLAWCYDERLGWSSRDEISASGVTVTDDARQLMIACGDVMVSGTARQGVWVLDRAGAAATGEVWTSWQRGTRSSSRGSQRKIRIQLRETLVSSTAAATKLQVTVERDYRVGQVGATYTVSLYPDEGVPATGYSTSEPMAWDTATWGEATFRERRPFWATIDVEVPSCEVWRLKMTSPSCFEILAIEYEEQPRDKSQGYS